MSDYFDSSTNRIIAGSLAKSSEVNDIIDKTSVGFDLLTSPTQIQTDTSTYGADTGAADAYEVALPKTQTAYTTGMQVVFIPVNSNTGASTIDVDGIGPKGIKRPDGTDVVAGDLLDTQVISLRYNGTVFTMTNPASSFAAAAASAAASSGFADASEASSIASSGFADASEASSIASAASAVEAAASATVAELLPGRLIDIQVFAANGTWNRPSGCKKIEVISVGAGGGGSYAEVPSSGNRFGSGGGGGGGVHGFIDYDEFVAAFPSNVLLDSAAIVVGVGGIGGLHATTDPATVGGDSSFAIGWDGGGQLITYKGRGGGAASSPAVDNELGAPGSGGLTDTTNIGGYLGTLLADAHGGPGIPSQIPTEWSGGAITWVIVGRGGQCAFFAGKNGQSDAVETDSNARVTQDGDSGKGGSGATTKVAGSAGNGGDGGDGFVIVKSYS